MQTIQEIERELKNKIFWASKDKYPGNGSYKFANEMDFANFVSEILEEPIKQFYRSKIIELIEGVKEIADKHMTGAYIEGLLDGRDKTGSHITKERLLKGEKSFSLERVKEKFNNLLDNIKK